MMEVMKTLLLLFALCLVARADYAGFKLVRAHLDNEKQMAEVNTWELDVWTRDSTLGIGWNDIVVNENHMAELLKMEVPFEVIIDNMEEHLEEGQRDLEQSRNHKSAVMADFFTAYHTYDEINAYLTELTSTHSSIAKLIPGGVGTSIQGRRINGLIITGTTGTNKKKIFVSGGQHAREWIAPATTLYILTQLITKYGNDNAVTALMNSAEFHFVPLVNPDGYNFTWGGSSQRLWRKNRRLNSGGSYGVDLNRNWDDHWGGEGSSGTQTSDTYRGTAAFSEPESKAVSNYILANKPFAGGIDYHCYSQLILRPWGWTKTPPENEARAKEVGANIRARILAVNNVAYTSEGAWELYYASGGASDWFLSKGGVSLSYTIELRDTGTYGFQLPASQIKPTGAENWAGFLYFAQTA